MTTKTRAIKKEVRIVVRNGNPVMTSIFSGRNDLARCLAIQGAAINIGADALPTADLCVALMEADIEAIARYSTLNPHTKQVEQVKRIEFINGDIIEFE